MLRSEKRPVSATGPLRFSQLESSYGEVLGRAEGEAAAPPPVLAVGIGEEIVCEPPGEVVDRVPNQFHCVKPRKRMTSSASAMSAAAMPAPAPDPVSVSTTSDPAGL